MTSDAGCTYYLLFQLSRLQRPRFTTPESVYVILFNKFGQPPFRTLAIRCYSSNSRNSHVNPLTCRILEKYVLYTHREPRNTRLKSGQCQVERPTRRTAEKEKSPEIWAKPAPTAAGFTKKLEEIRRSYGSGMIRLVTAVKKRLFERIVPFRTKTH